jgi:hypothetical protein
VFAFRAPACTQRCAGEPPVNAITPARPLHDGEPVLSARLGSLPAGRVERATYGVPDSPDRTRDVRLKVQQKVDAGERSFQVSSLAEGDDPAPTIRSARCRETHQRAGIRIPPLTSVCLGEIRSERSPRAQLLIGHCFLARRRLLTLRG